MECLGMCADVPDGRHKCQLVQATRAGADQNTRVRDNAQVERGQLCIASKAAGGNTQTQCMVASRERIKGQWLLADKDV